MTGQLLLALRLLLLISLYVLLAAILIGLFYDIWRHSNRLASKRTPTLSLSRTSSDEASVFSSSRSQFTLGRNPACDCVVDQATISQIHARFSFKQGHWWIEDLNSTNGTFLNEERIITAVVLTPSDRLRFGEVEYAISWEAS
jgi:hypothetical protein